MEPGLLSIKSSELLANPCAVFFVYYLLNLVVIVPVNVRMFFHHACCNAGNAELERAYAIFGARVVVLGLVAVSVVNLNNVGNHVYRPACGNVGAYNFGIRKRVP